MDEIKRVRLFPNGKPEAVLTGESKKTKEEAIKREESLTLKHTQGSVRRLRLLRSEKMGRVLI